MDGEQDRDQEYPQGQAEDAAVPGLIGLTQGGKADPKDQDEDQESADVEKSDSCEISSARVASEHRYQVTP